jgi:hypothetical protein
MRRSWLWMLCAAGALVAGCTDYGSYRVEWRFLGRGGETVGADCGLHGVDSIRVIGSNAEGERDDFAALCTTGQLVRSVPVGTWTFSVQQVDVRGARADTVDAAGQPLAPMAGAMIVEDATVPLAVIAEDGTMPLDPGIVELTPRPECKDRVDNDDDGRVDLDDFECAGDENGAAE